MDNYSTSRNRSSASSLARNVLLLWVSGCALWVFASTGTVVDETAEGETAKERIRVEGVATRGGRPLETTLRFGVRGLPSLFFESDENGRFIGYLPHEGSWPVEVSDPRSHMKIRLRPVEVETGPGGQTAEVEVEIPDTRLSGRVTDAEGRPVPRAMVSLVNLGLDLEPAARSSHLASDRKGEFEAWGMVSGDFLVTAQTNDGASASTSITLEEGSDPGPVELTVREWLRISGRVVSSSGPVPGARIRAKSLVPGSSSSKVEDALSGVDGRFELKLASGSEAVELAVLPPGFAARFLRLPVAPDQSLEIRVEQLGGTVVVSLPESDETQPWAQPFLHHDGGRIPVSWLASSWGRPHSGEGRIALGLMEPGDYQLCVGERCAEGFLVPAGELLLEPVPVRR